MNEPSRDHQGLFSGLRIVSLCTLLSRVLGLIRDIGMAALFGNGPIMDAFSVAFRIPNLARRLFGEGAVTAAFLPAFVRTRDSEGEQSAWKLATGVLIALGLFLTGGVLVGELALGIVSLGNLGDETQLLVGLTATLLPYLILICLAAQLSSVLHAYKNFSVPALLPVVLNVVWIATIWLIAPQLETPQQQVYAIAAALLGAGVLQVLAPLPALRKIGFQFLLDWKEVREPVYGIGRSMIPILIGLSITQVNTLADSLIAWSFAAPETADAASRWPLESGTASALYFGQRMYQFPLGVFGIALGTVLFPRLSEHAQRGQLDRLADDLSLGLRLVLLIGLPAGAGLMLIGQPLTELLFRHGAFDGTDARQTTEMIIAYGSGVWAYCALLILHRGYYALGDAQTPMRIGLGIAVLNLLGNLTLIWPFGGSALAWTTAGCAMLQTVAAAWWLQRRIGMLDWKRLGIAAFRISIATFLMSAGVLATLHVLPAGEAVVDRLVAVVAPVAVAIGVYLAACQLLGLTEIWSLIRRKV